VENDQDQPATRQTQLRRAAAGLEGPRWKRRAA